MTATQDFARFLREEYWNYGGDCENDFVVTLAVKETKVWTSVGAKAQAAGMQLHCVNEVFTEHGEYFYDGHYGDGLRLMMDDCR